MNYFFRLEFDPPHLFFQAVLRCWESSDGRFCCRRDEGLFLWFRRFCFGCLSFDWRSWNLRWMPPYSTKTILQAQMYFYLGFQRCCLAFLTDSKYAFVARCRCEQFRLPPLYLIRKNHFLFQTLGLWVVAFGI